MFLLRLGGQPILVTIILLLGVIAIQDTVGITEENSINDDDHIGANSGRELEIMMCIFPMQMA